MKISLQFIFENFVTHNCISTYLQEDGKYFVLVTPLNPAVANDYNVREFRDLTIHEAFSLMRP